MSDTSKRPDLNPDTFTAEQEAAAARIEPSAQSPSDEEILADVLTNAHGDPAARLAIARCRAAHPDTFDFFMKTMAFVSRACRPDWERMSLDEYLESLYAITMHADFMAEHRRKIMAAVQPVVGRPN